VVREVVQRGLVLADGCAQASVARSLDGGELGGVESDGGFDRGELSLRLLVGGGLALDLLPLGNDRGEVRSPCQGDGGELGVEFLGNKIRGGKKKNSQLAKEKYRKQDGRVC